jgi:hypothetical protein
VLPGGYKGRRIEQPRGVGDKFSVGAIELIKAAE